MLHHASSIIKLLRIEFVTVIGRCPRRVDHNHAGRQPQRPSLVHILLHLRIVLVIIPPHPRCKRPVRRQNRALRNPRKMLQNHRELRPRKQHHPQLLRRNRNHNIRRTTRIQVERSLRRRIHPQPIPRLTHKKRHRLISRRTLRNPVVLRRVLHDRPRMIQRVEPLPQPIIIRRIPHQKLPHPHRVSHTRNLHYPRRNLLEVQLICSHRSAFKRKIMHQQIRPSLNIAHHLLARQRKRHRVQISPNQSRHHRLHHSARGCRHACLRRSTCRSRNCILTNPRARREHHHPKPHHSPKTQIHLLQSLHLSTVERTSSTRTKGKRPPWDLFFLSKFFA